MTQRTSVITDWHVRDESALPDVPPGGEFESVITPQKFIVLRRILVRDMTLVRLQVGAVDVPFELEVADGPQWTYKPRRLDEALGRRLVAIGAAIATSDSIAVVPGLDVRAVVRNETPVTTKPRVALLVQEEI